MKWAPRIRLRTIFLLIFCAAVGLACGTSPSAKVDPSLVGIIDPPQLNWHYGLLSAASMAMVIGLVQQIGQLARLGPASRTEHGEFTFAVRYAVVWRAVVAATILVCLLLQLFVCRELFQLPEHRDLFSYEIVPNQLWLFCVIVVLSDSVARWRRKPARIRELPGQVAAAWLLATFLVLMLLPDAGIISFLVYLALGNIEGAQSYVHQRMGTYPNQLTEGFRLFWMCLTAVGVVILAAVALASTSRDDTFTRRTLKIVSFLFLLFAAAVFGVWYHLVELSRISPEMAEAGFPGNWLDWSGASLLVAFAVSVGACRQARGERTLKVVEYPANLRDQISLHESFACQLLLIVAAIVYLEEMFRGYFSPGPFGRLPFGEFVRYTMQDPTSVLCIAITVLSLQLAWICWRRRNETFVWKLSNLDARRFVWSWLGLAALVVVGIPAISAYCFAFWLGPWYLYGN